MQLSRSAANLRWLALLRALPFELPALPYPLLLCLRGPRRAVNFSRHQCLRRSNSTPWVKTSEVSTRTCEDVRATYLMFEPVGCRTMLSLTFGFHASKLNIRVYWLRITFIRYCALGTMRVGGLTFHYLLLSSGVLTDFRDARICDA